MSNLHYGGLENLVFCLASQLRNVKVKLFQCYTRLRELAPVLSITQGSAHAALYSTRTTLFKRGTMQYVQSSVQIVSAILLKFLNNSWQCKNKSPVRYIRSSHSWTTHFQWQSRVIYSHNLCTWDHNSTYGIACIHWKINDFIHIISKDSFRILTII